MLAQIHKDYPDVRIVFRHFPLPSHDKSLIAAAAAEAAGAQGKFWEYDEMLFTEQANWAQKTAADFTTWAVDQAGKLGLDKTKFETDMNSQAIVDKVKQAQDAADKAQVPYTPYLIINGRELPDSMPRDYDTLVSMVKLFGMEGNQEKACPPMTIDPKKQYTATLKTDKGDIVIQLYADKAPMAVNSFVYLAKKGYFNGVTFHRVLPDFVAQSGDPSGTGYGGPGYAFGNEISGLKYDKEGVVGMANAGPDSNGSQFFITYAPAPTLDGQYTIFGQVVQGMDVAKKLTPRDPSQGGTLPPGDKINEVVITEK